VVALVCTGSVTAVGPTSVGTPRSVPVALKGWPNDSILTGACCIRVRLSMKGSG